MQVLNNKNTHTGGHSPIKADTLFRSRIQVTLHGTDAANSKTFSICRRIRHGLIINSGYFMDFKVIQSEKV